MSICIYCKYDVSCLTKYTYLNEEGDFAEGVSTFSKVMDGGELMEILINCLKDSDISTIRFLNNRIIVDNFDPHSGETSLTEIKFTEVTNGN